MPARLAPALLLAALTGLLFSPFWSRGEVFVPGDFLSFIYPWKAQAAAPSVRNLELFDVITFFVPMDHLLREGLAEGRVPLWNPYIFSGHPVSASGQSGFLYPVRLLLHSLLDLGQARTVGIWLHLLGMGLGMYTLLRLRGHRRDACFLGGAIWMLNSFATSWMEFEHVPTLSALTVWALVCLEGGLAGRRWGFPVMGLLAGLGLVAGHLQINLYGLTLIAFYAGLRMRELGRWRALPALALALAAAALLAAPALLPFFELLPLSGRRAFAPEELKQMASPLWMILPTLMCPDAWGNPALGFLVNRSPMNYIFPEFACFAGSLPLGLALAQLRDRRAWPWLGLIGVSLLAAAATTPYLWLASRLPFLSQLIPGRILFLVPFALALLAAQGVDRLPALRGRLIAAWAGCATLWAGWLGLTGWALSQPSRRWEAWLNPGWVKIPPYDPTVADWPAQVLAGAREALLLNPQAWLSLALPAALAVAWRRGLRPDGWGLGLLTGLELVLFAARFNPAVDPAALFPPSPTLTRLQGQPGRVLTQGAAFYNTLMPYRIASVTGYESLVPRRYLDLLELSQGAPVNLRMPTLKRTDSPVLDMLGVEWVLVNPHLPGLPLEEVAREGAVLYRRAGREGRGGALPRAWVVGETSLGGLEALGRPGFDPRRVAVVEVPVRADPAAAGSPVTMIQEGTDQLRLQVDMRAPGIVVLSEAWMPGWRASDGTLLRVNHALRGLALPAGRFEVKMTYQPDSWRRGLQLALLGGLVALMAGWATPRPRREGPASPGLEALGPASPGLEALGPASPGLGGETANGGGRGASGVSPHPED